MSLDTAEKTYKGLSKTENSNGKTTTETYKGSKEAWYTLTAAVDVPFCFLISVSF